MVAWRVFRLGVADSHNFDEEQDSDPQESENSDPDPHSSEQHDPDPHKSYADPQTRGIQQKFFKTLAPGLTSQITKGKGEGNGSGAEGLMASQKPYLVGGWVGLGRVGQTTGSGPCRVLIERD
jgi:hypothetical protein